MHSAQSVAPAGMIARRSQSPRHSRWKEVSNVGREHVMLTTVAFRRAAAVAALALTVAPLGAQNPVPPEDVRARYTKYEYMVPMRDGVRLFTSIYAPKDTAQT